MLIEDGHHTWLHAGVPPHGLLGSGVYCEVAPNDEAGSCCSTHHALQRSQNELGGGISQREPATKSAMPSWAGKSFLSGELSLQR